MQLAFSLNMNVSTWRPNFTCVFCLFVSFCVKTPPGPAALIPPECRDATPHCKNSHHEADVLELKVGPEQHRGGPVDSRVCVIWNLPFEQLHSPSAANIQEDQSPLWPKSSDSKRRAWS